MFYDAREHGESYGAYLARYTGKLDERQLWAKTRKRKGFSKLTLADVRAFCADRNTEWHHVKRKYWEKVYFRPMFTVQELAALKQQMKARLRYQRAYKARFGTKSGVDVIIDNTPRFIYRDYYRNDTDIDADAVERCEPYVYTNTKGDLP